MLSLLNAGTIPDRGLYAVHLGEGGPRIGELDEEMVYEARRGETFTLGASTWRIEAITRDRVVVSAAPGEPGKTPFWRGDGPGRPLELGLASGRHTLAFSAGGHEDLRRDIYVEPGATTRLAPELEPVPWWSRWTTWVAVGAVVAVGAGVTAALLDRAPDLGRAEIEVVPR